MANTFNLGNGNWASKKEAVLAYNSENSNYKPLPFTFDRGSIGTVVNKQGLIETVGIDEPRIDFLNNTKGHLLLEPSRSNYLLNNQNLQGSGWANNGGITLEFNQDDPFGSSNAVKMTDFNDIADRYDANTSKAGVSGETVTYSGYYKGSGSINISINTSTGLGGGFEKTIDLTDEWVRHEIKHTFTSDVTGNYRAHTAITRTANNDAVVYLSYPQIEVGSYATSIIITQGSAVTRSSEMSFEREDMVDLNLYSSEMTWFYDINLFYREAGTTVAPRLINTSNSQVFIGLSIPNSPNTDLRIRHKDGTTAANTSAVDFTPKGRVKIAVKITGTTGTAYINGTNVGTFTTLAASNYDKYENVQNNPNNINDMRFYNTALSDSELATLTTL